MAFKTADRVRDTSTSTGTGNFTVSGTAPIGFRTLSAVLTATDTFYYAIQHQTLAEWEVGLGTYSATANQFARTTVLSSSNAGSSVNFSAGSKDVFITLAAGKSVQVDGSGNPVNLGTLSVANGGTGATTLTGLVVGNGTSAFTTTAAPAGDLVGTTDTQTLTNKTVEAGSLTNGYTEAVYAIPSSTTPALSPTNGSIQTWVLTGASTPTAGTWAAGQSMTLMIDDGSSSTISWASVPVVWAGGTAPTLATSGYTVVQLWKVGTTIYGALTGDVA